MLGMKYLIVFMFISSIAYGQSNRAIQFVALDSEGYTFPNLDPYGSVISEKVYGKNLYRYKLIPYQNIDETLRSLKSLGYKDAFISSINKKKGRIDNKSALSSDYTISQQFLKGESKRFSTKGHFKSKAPHWSVSIPNDWSEREGDRPNTLKVFSGNKEIQLVIIEKKLFDKGAYEPNILEKRELLESAGSFLPNDMYYNIRSELIKIDNQDGAFVFCESKESRLGIEMDIRSYIFYFINENVLCTVHFALSDLNSLSNFSELSSKYEQLIFLIANSIVIDSKY